MRVLFKIVTLFLGYFLCFSCIRESVPPEYITANVIVVVIDGARFSETWGDSTWQNIPFQANQMAPSGVVNTSFYNLGPTYTLAGHTAITTGVYQEIDNLGREIPQHPSFFQYFNLRYFGLKKRACFFSSKDKLEILNNCLDSVFLNNGKPFTDCGMRGLGSGLRDDSITVDHFLSVLGNYHPQLSMVSFREPDYSGHLSNWAKCLEGIRKTDEYAWKIWSFIQSDSCYAGKTTLFITSDHGRHLDEVSNGFASHGDGCMGCRHLSLYAFGPDFKNGVFIQTPRELTDLTATISELLHLDMKTGTGRIMTELFRE